MAEEFALGSLCDDCLTNGHLVESTEVHWYYSTSFLLALLCRVCIDASTIPFHIKVSISRKIIPHR